MIYPQTARKDTVRPNAAPGGWKALAGTPEHDIEWLIPSDSADFLDPRPRQALYTSPVVIPGGVDVEMNSPTAFHKPQPPRYEFHKHFDYGLLRERPGTLQFDMWGPKSGTWYRIEFNPFTASMSPITIGRAEELVDGGDLYAPNVERT